MQSRVQFYEKVTLQTLKGFSGSLTNEQRVQTIRDILNEGINTGDTVTDVLMPTTWLSTFMDWEVGAPNDLVVRIHRGSFAVDQDLAATNSTIVEGQCYWTGRGVAFFFGGAASTIYKVFAWYGVGGPHLSGHGDLWTSPEVKPVKYYTMSGGPHFTGTAQQIPVHLNEGEVVGPTYTPYNYSFSSAAVRGSDILVVATASSPFCISSYDKNTSTWAHWASNTGIADAKTHLGKVWNTNLGIVIASDSTYTVIAGGNNVASWDGSNWKNFDGSGDGTGPYAWELFNPDANFPSPYPYITDVILYNGKFVFMSYGRISSWDPSTGWKHYDGTGTGNGPYNDGSALGITSGIDYNSLMVYFRFAIYGSNLIAFAMDRLASFDGTNWKNYDGSGSGTGPYGEGLLGTGYYITAATQYVASLVVGGNSGRISSFDGSNWKYYTGSGSGSGPYNSGATIASSNVGGMIQAGALLIVTNLGSVGRVASFDGANWKNSDGTGTGTGPYDAGTNVYTSYYGYKGIIPILFNGAVVFLADNNHISSWDGANWKKYDGSGSGTGLYGIPKEAGFYPVGMTTGAPALYDEKLILVAGNPSRFSYYDLNTLEWVPYNSGTGITASTSYVDFMIIGYGQHIYNGFYVAVQQNGKISSWDGTAWKKYDGTGSGTGPYGDLTTHGITSIRVSAIYNSCLVIGGNGGKIASFDGTNWKYPDGSGTGTGPYSDGTATGGKEISFNLATYDGKLIIPTTGSFRSAYDGMVASFDGANWKNYDGSGSGTGPYKTSLGFQPYGAFSYDGDLLVYGYRASGYFMTMSSWDGANWKNFDGTGTGTGLYYGGTMIGSGAVAPIIAGSSLVMMANQCMVNSYDGSNWKYWDGSGGGTGPFGEGQYLNYDSSGGLVLNGDILYAIGYLEQVATCKVSNSKWFSSAGNWIDPISSVSDEIATRVVAEFWTRVDPGYSLRNTSTTVFKTDVTFPTSGAYGTSISWDVNHGFISSSGVVTRPEGQAVTGSAMATVTKGSSTSANYNAGIYALGWSSTYNRSQFRLNNSNRLTASSGAGPNYVSGTYLDRVAIASENSEISNFDLSGATWTNYNAGSGLCDNGSYVTGAVYDVHGYSTESGDYLMVICDDGISSWDGTAWKKYDGTGTGSGPYWSFNGGTNPTSVIYRDIYIVASNSSRISSYDGTAWKKYDGTGTGSGPYDNGNVVVSTAPMVKPILYKGGIVAFAADNTVGSWDGTNFKNYDGSGSGTGAYNADVGFVIKAMTIDWNGNLVVGGNGGKIASFDGTNWKYSDGSGSGTGPYNDGTIIGGMDISQMILCANKIIVFASGSGVCRFGNISSTGTRKYDGTGSGYGLYSGTDNFFLGASAQLVSVAQSGSYGSFGATQAAFYMIGNYERIANVQIAGNSWSGYSYTGTLWSS